MIKYCKAYPIEKFRAFDKWSENIPETEVVTAENGDTSAEASERFLYLHDTYVVTDGIFGDEKIVFQDVTPEWVEFCQNELKFELPDYELPVKQENTSSAAA